MTRRPRLVLALALVVVALVAVVIALALRVRTTGELAERHARFCRTTRWALAEDHRDFSSTDPSRRAAALARFYGSSVTYHNTDSVQLCTTAPLPEMPLACLVEPIWPCLARLARQLEDLVAAGE